MNGQSTFTGNLAEGLAHRGHEVWVVTNSEYGSHYEIDHNGVHIWTISAAEIKFLHNQAYTNLFPVLEVNRVFHHFQPDILHLQDHYPLSHSMLAAARRRGIPVIGTNHFMPENLAPYIPLLPRLWPVFSGLLWWWMKLVYNRVDIVTAPSATAAGILTAQGLRPPVYPVSCGVSLDRFQVDPTVDRAAIRHKYDLDNRRVIFHFVGRVDAEKKVDILIRAVKLLNRPDIQLAVTGNGAALHHYQDLVAELGVQELGALYRIRPGSGSAPLAEQHRYLQHAQRGRTAQYSQPGGHGYRSSAAGGALQGPARTGHGGRERLPV